MVTSRVVASCAVLAALGTSEVMTKFSLRNLSGGSIGVWWIEPAPRGKKRRMVPQTAVSIRNSSSLEVNSYRGHEFAIRRLGWKEKITEQEYEPSGDEATLVIGATNDIVIVDESLGLARHDAARAVRRALEDTLASPLASVADVREAMTAVLERWARTWLAEEGMRRDMERDLVALGGDVPKPPIPPPEGWPERDPGFARRAVETALASCGGWRGVPREPARFDDDVDALSKLNLPALRGLLEAWDDRKDVCAPGTEGARAFELAVRGDAHATCARWARVGECAVNPRYMLAACARSCALWNAYGRATVPVPELLEGAQPRDEFLHCVAGAVDPVASRLKGAVNAEQNAKTGFSEDLRNRTCASTSPNATSRGPHQTEQHPDFVDAEGRAVRVSPLFAGALAMSTANISLLDKFATEEECQQVMDSARPRLRPATVNSEENPAAVSMSRRARAANLEADPDHPDHPVSKLWRRAFDVANFLTGYDLDPHGQEPFSVISYDTPKEGGLPDEYRPHCDGSCDGSPHLHGGRVATLLLYCATADEGGATTFTNARTVATPEPRDAVFFSYLNKDTNEMATEVVQHSGCPVLSGEKWVATLWYRKGISAADAWTSYDPTGARHAETAAAAAAAA
ncbi:hypothetical protein CTAYLR_004382 [Chrysophaeum taylorii]|uniref:Fe2OG dioxygenase domain-containing protein n=1 Tax=Chrysophaeum taylorii TaxID=2483200 RepID=A0AAD7UMH4_9STRA|nr:hypothetical protein CTAYLR_004382 [Chrysophaeum taylorii]